MPDVDDAVFELLRVRDYDLGMKPAQMADVLGVPVEDISAALESLARQGRAHPTSFGNWDHGPPLPSADQADIDQR